MAGLSWYDPKAPPASAPSISLTQQAPPAPPAPPAAHQPPKAGTRQPERPAQRAGASQSRRPEVAENVVTVETSAEAEVGRELDAMLVESAATESSASQAPPPETRTMDVLEVVRSVDQATKAKETLARQSLTAARDGVSAQRAALRAQMEEQERNLVAEERRLKQLEEELRSGCNKDEKKQIQALRAKIEVAGRAEVAALRETETRREAMRCATDAYVESEERLTLKKQERKKLEDAMLDLVLSTGKAKDARLTEVLMKVPEVRHGGEETSTVEATPSTSDKIDTGESEQPAPIDRGG